jgi:kynurenine formamidase
MRLVDLSHVIDHQMVTYPGLPGPEISEYLSFEASHDLYAAGTEFAIGRISMVANTGTYLDTPGHRFRDGHDLSTLPLQRCADLPAVVIDGGGAIDADVLSDAAVTGAAVLLRTGWDRHWGTQRYGDPEHPHLTEAGARVLVERRAALVGIDSVNIDDTTTGQRPAHTLLLAAGIPVVEHLTDLADLPRTGARFTAVPPAIRGLATFPVRAFAALPTARSDEEPTS